MLGSKKKYKKAGLEQNISMMPLLPSLRQPYEQVVVVTDGCYSYSENKGGELKLSKSSNLVFLQLLLADVFPQLSRELWSDS